MVRRVAVIDREKCNPVGCGGYLCAKLCPVNRTGKDCIYPGQDDAKARIDEVLCTGCGICPKRCPFDAITIINLPEQLEKEPIHRYGENLFELFSLPIPVFGKVVGVLGKNGTGKSTAVKILAQLLKPNIGNWKKGAAAFDEVKAYFAGTEMQLFLELLHQGKIKVSYKPQQVDLIPKQYNGTVRALLQKADEKKQFDKIVKELELEKFLDTDVKSISGGELQRVALAAAVLKDAQLFVFDEPTSYLDVKQRMRISHFLRKIPDEQTAELIVEHDLVILDYMADLLHIMYGEESVYGVVSGLKSTREGINAFLDGYLREENIRFREKPLKFEKTPTVEGREKAVVCSWDHLRKKLGRFELQTKQGEVYKGEVVGVLGENGIGKTTFMKLLAGVEKADGGAIQQKRISYKPQYLETESMELVVMFLQQAIQKYTNQLIVPLGLDKLFTKQLCQLSGGELQRVAIARALGQESDLYLLDEPSAYLDVEQRILVAKLLKQFADEKGVAILVIDHDLMFMDYVANKLIVFHGEPASFGIVAGPFGMETGMNLFLKELGITFRRDIDSHRPRVNKQGSVLDREQKGEGKYYYG